MLKNKVGQIVVMGGNFPSSFERSPEKLYHVFDKQPYAEYNFANYGAAGVTKHIVEELQSLEIPTTYVGFEVAFNKLRVGGAEFDSLPADHPVGVAYRYRHPTITNLNPLVDGAEFHIENHAFDEVALFYLVEGEVGKYFNRVEKGYLEVFEDNANQWHSYDDGARGTVSTESYLELNQEYANELTSILDNRILGELD